MKLIILDPAHGINVSGKHSPVISKEFAGHEDCIVMNNEVRFKEFLWSRNVLRLIANKLNERGVDVAFTVELEDTTEQGLSFRRNRTNALAKEVGNDAFFFSLHSNALGYGESFYNARGFCIYTTVGQTRSDKFAELLIEKFSEVFPELKVRRETSDNDSDYEANFAVLRCTCPAVLVECLFYTNKEDLAVLMSDDFKEKFATMCADVLEDIYNNY